MYLINETHYTVTECNAANLVRQGDLSVRGHAHARMHVVRYHFCQDNGL